MSGAEAERERTGRRLVQRLDAAATGTPRRPEVFIEKRLDRGADTLGGRTPLRVPVSFMGDIGAGADPCRRLVALFLAGE
jgi:hypothetical protein